LQAARATGADVPVCLDPRPRVMRGVGDILSEPLDLPRLPAVLVNPGVAVPTKDVFAMLDRHPEVRAQRASQVGSSRLARSIFRSRVNPRSVGGSNGTRGHPSRPGFAGHLRMTDFLAAIDANGNDLEGPAITFQAVIADLLDALRSTPACRLARMSGSDATCFALFDSMRAAA